MRNFSAFHQELFRHRLWLASILLIPACFLKIVHGAETVLTRFTFGEAHMGTWFKLIVYAPDQPGADRAAKAAFKRIADLDGIMSDYRPASELMQLCQKAGGDPIPVSKDLFVVLARAEEVARLSDGAFDVTVGPVVRLWRRARKTQVLPDLDQLAKARALVGFDKVHLDEKTRSVRLDKVGMLLDLGGIAKGYAADAALEVLREQGFNRALVAASGDIAVSGSPPDKEGWTIAIAPLDETSPPTRYLTLNDAAVSTSGDAEQYVEIGGKRYSHIVDPKTGLGLVGHSSVTVIARHGLLADPLTKVVSVLGPERGLKILSTQDGVSALVVRQGDKGEETFATKNFPTKRP